MRIYGNGLMLRHVELTDVESVRQIVNDWSHDGRRPTHAEKFDYSRAERTVRRWVHNMIIEPAERPVTATSVFQEAWAVCLDEVVIGLDVYRVRSSEWLSICEVQTQAIHPDYRGQGWHRRFNEPMSIYVFERLQCTGITFETAPVPQVDATMARFNTRETGSRKGTVQQLKLSVLTTADWVRPECGYREEA